MIKKILFRAKGTVATGRQRSRIGAGLAERIAALNAALTLVTTSSIVKLCHAVPIICSQRRATGFPGAQAGSI